MPSNRFKCSEEVLKVAYPHKCSKVKSVMKPGKWIHENLAEDKQYKICLVLRNNINRKRKNIGKSRTERETLESGIQTDENTNNIIVRSAKRQRRCMEELLKDEIPKLKYRTKIRDATSLHRMQIIKDIALTVLSATIDNKLFQRDGMNYLFENSENISVDVGFILDNITRLISKWMKYSIKQHYKDSIPPSHDDQCMLDLKNDQEDIDRISYFNDLDKEGTKSLCKDMIIETSQNGYQKLRASISKLFRIEAKLIPSFYLATKHRCKLITGEVDYLSEFKFLQPQSSENKITKSNDKTDYEGKKQKVTKKYFAKIDGGCEKAYSLLIDKLERRFINTTFDSVIMFDSFDGANHLETPEGKIDLVSFSSTLVNDKLLSLPNYSTARSSSILTFMQVAAKEEPCMLLSVLKNHYESRIKLKDKLKNDGINLCLFDVHDGKMIYNIMQHSQWNRKHHPFILCKCKRGNAVKNLEHHTCDIIGDEDQLMYYNKSAVKFEQCYSNTYTQDNFKKHCDWADRKNYGITHFGLHPKLLPNSRVAFDNLHNRLSNVRQIWDYIRNYVNVYGYDLQSKFTNILRKELSDYYVQCHDTGKSLAVMHGEQIEAFINLIPVIMNFMKESFELTSELNSIIEMLETYPLIDKFLRITKVIDTNADLKTQEEQKSNYENNFKIFKQNLIMYQKAAANTILTKNTLGDNENFYSHVLFCYYPYLIQKIWDEHKVGIGIFTLQGFERRNKESKNSARRFYNGRHNICQQVMNRVYDFFFFSE